MERLKNFFLEQKEKWALRRKNRISRGKDEIVMRWVFFVIFAIYAVTLVVPFLYIIVNSLYGLTEYNSHPEIRTHVALEYFNLHNYVQAFDYLSVRTSTGESVSLIVMFGNSIMYIVITVVPTIASSLMAAYVMSKYDFKGKSVIYSIVIIMQVVPIIGAQASSYKLMHDLQLVNRPWLYWITCCSGFDFAFVLFYGYYNSVSWEYGEAAQIDGAGNLRIFWHVMLPQAKPIITALVITTAISSWNDYMTPYMYLYDYPTVAYGIYYYKNEMNYVGNPPVLYAGIVMAAIPALVLFSVFHQTIMENTVAGGLKG